MSQHTQRNNWYWDSVVSLHIDNHSGLVGKGYSVEQLTEMVRAIPIAMIQVSAFGAVGTTTYPTAIRPHPDLGDWDTLAVWKQVAENCGTRFGVYINTRGLRLPDQHPEWAQRDANCKGRGKHGGLDICARPSADGSGALEQVLLPMLSEITTRYRPDAVWVDGDHARTATCYCVNCVAAWRAETGKSRPPTTPDDPDWAAWCLLEQQRVDRYREQMAEAIHDGHPACMYTSNHSWRFRTKDPRCAPRGVDTLSGDLSHGLALRMTRLCAMQLAPEQSLPYDIMHNVMRISGEAISPRRILQQGALSLASGGAWFLWSPGSAIVQPPVQQRLKLCAEFARARAAALGRTTSASQVAVLVSESSWRVQREQGQTGYYDTDAPEHAALALQDAGFSVDMPNETILWLRIAGYRVIVVANQRRLAPRTTSALRDFVQNGGILLVTGSGLRAGDGEDSGDERELLGLRRPELRQEVCRATLGDETVVARSAWSVDVQEADTLAAFDSGAALLTKRTLGKGRVAYLSLPTPQYPDDDGVLAWTMQALGIGPSVQALDAARDRHLAYSLRRRPGQVIVHITDLTTLRQGRRVMPTSHNDIDAEPALALTKLALPLAQPPDNVRTVPATTLVSHRWRDGVLHLDLKGLDLHCAVILDVTDESPLRLMSAATPMAKRHIFGALTEEGFETLSPRETLPESIGLCRTDANTSIRVTARTAATGGRSLKFTDHPDATKPFFPYLVIRPRGLNRDAIYMCLDLMLEDGVEAQIELREVENAREFPVGPSLVFTGGGTLRAAGRDEPLCDIPADTWLEISLIARLDGSAVYDVRVRRGDGTQSTFRDLPFRSPKFVQCGWGGIIGIGTNAGSFYVDDLRIGRGERADVERMLAERRPRQANPAHTVQATTEDGVAGYWPIEEEQGNVALDRSGNRNHGHSQGEWVRGPFGSAIRLSGKTGSNVMVEDDASLQFGTGSFSLSCWLFPLDLESPKGYRRILEKPGYPDTWWNVDSSSNGHVEMEMGDKEAGSGTTVSQGALPLNRWTHLCIVVDREQKQVSYYFDGRLDSAAAIPGSFSARLDVRGRDLFIGGSHLPFIGLMDDVRIHRRSLSTDEIDGHFQTSAAERRNLVWESVE